MNSSLNPINIDPMVYVFPFLLHSILGIALVVSFLFAKKFVNAELHKLKSNGKFERIAILTSGIVLSILILLACVVCINFVLEHWWDGTDIFCSSYILQIIIFSVLLVTSYTVTVPDGSYLRLLNISDNDVRVIYRKFLRLVSVSFCTMVAASIVEEKRCFFSGLMVIYYFLEMLIAQKLIKRAMQIKKSIPDSFSFKFITYINDKIIYLCLLGMSWVIFTNHSSPDLFFFETLKNIYCFVFMVFLIQMLVSQIIIKFAEQLDSIKNGTYTKLSIQRRQKNLIFICDIIVMAFYLSILYAFLGCISVYMQERIFHEKIVIVGIILATIIAYKGFNELADSLLEKADGPDNCAGYKIKLQTFLPTVSAIFHIILFITAGLLVLANLGISIAPILATFTVFSAAVGLAAQDIIRSFLHGITFLIEEDLYVGAYVEINGMNGVIEKLSARVLYLRGDDGALYTIPYNVISVVTNCSKNYSYYYGTLQIHKEDDVDEISEILRQVVDGMQKEESYRDAILGKAEIFGLKPFDLFSLKIFWRVKTSPNAKGIIAKYEIYKRLYTMYKKHGISIPSANYIIHTDS